MTDLASSFESAYGGRTVCVSGGAGFIGSHLVDTLVAAGADVRVLDDFSAGLESNLADVAGEIRLIRGSLLDDDAVADAVAGADTIFHLAAIASVPRSVAEPALYVRVNVTGTQNLLEASRQAGSRRFVLASSSSVYGDQPGMPRVETLPHDTRSPYAASKAAAEHLVRAYGCCFPMRTLSLRYFNIFGPRQRPDTPYAAVVPRFVDKLRRGERPVVYGDGTQTRDFTYVDNAVYANMLAGACDRPLAGEVVNVACGEPHGVLNVLRAIGDELGIVAECEFEPMRPGEVQDSAADVSAAHELIGYSPVVGFREGLARTVAALVG